jgi:hypothetical protein
MFNASQTEQQSNVGDFAKEFKYGRQSPTCGDMPPSQIVRLESGVCFPDEVQLALARYFERPRKWGVIRGHGRPTTLIPFEMAFMMRSSVSTSQSRGTRVFYRLCARYDGTEG